VIKKKNEKSGLEEAPQNCPNLDPIRILGIKNPPWGAYCTK